MLNLATPSRQVQYRRCLNYFAPVSYSTTERDALRDKIAGMTIWNKDTTQFEHWDGTAWIGAGAGGSTAMTVLKTAPAGVTIPSGTQFLSITDVDEIANGSSPVTISTENSDKILGADTFDFTDRGGTLQLYLDGTNYIRI